MSDKKVVKGLRCDIYRGSYRSKNNMLGHVGEVTLVGPEIDAVGGNVFEPTADAPAVRLVLRNMRGPIVHAEPVDKPEGLCGPMAGGSFIETSDSRFDEAIRKLLGHEFYGAVTLHDYFETWEQYQRNSI